MASPQLFSGRARSQSWWAYNMKTIPIRPNACRGHTLMDMLIVVAVITAMAAITWPALRGPLGKSHLREAAKQIRIELAKTRLRAIETGTSQEFRYQPGSSRFQVAARATAGVDEEYETEPASPKEALYVALREEELPEGVCFASAENDDAPVAPDTEAVDPEEPWSEPILFYPNGRTVDARIRLVGQRRFHVDVALRGLTGMASVGQLQRVEDSP